MRIMAVLMLQASVAAPAADENPIVVTGQSLGSTEKALRACLSRQCPAREDIAASLAHAENLFVAGDYAEARSVLMASRRRNARFASSMPLDVAGLSRANARLASAVGLPDVARINAIETVEALRAGLPANDPRILSERLAVGDGYARKGRLIAAIDLYRDVARQARRDRHWIVEGNALFRVAAAYGAVATFNPAYAAPARAATEEIARTTEPELAPFRDGIVLLQARLAGLAGDRKALDTAIARVKASDTLHPKLLDAPLAKPDLTDDGFEVFLPGRRDPQWADVGFRIAPDGTVRDLVILREHVPGGRGWLSRQLSALGKRRYAPLDLPADALGVARVERLTYVHDLVATTGTRLRQPSQRGRLDVVDLTREPGDRDQPADPPVVNRPTG